LVPTRPATHEYQTTRPARSHTSRVVDDLGLQIVSGRYRQGSLLPGDIDLIDRYKVSRTVLREALKTLSAKGLLQAKARIGTRVRERADWNLFDPDVLVWHARNGFAPEFLTHLGEMRMALEPEAAAFAARRRTPEQLAEMQMWAAKMSDPAISQQDFVDADLGLHLAVAQGANNPFFLSISTLIEVALVAMLTISSPVENAERLAASVGQHRAIVDAIAARDPEGARKAMGSVVQTGIDRTH
jgi:DNA-binding FadR family transcriptional regulator